MGCGLGWFVRPKFSLCDELGCVEEIGPTDNSASLEELTSSRSSVAVFCTRVYIGHHPGLSPWIYLKVTLFLTVTLTQTLNN